MTAAVCNETDIICLIVVPERVQVIQMLKHSYVHNSTNNKPDSSINALGTLTHSASPRAVLNIAMFNISLMAYSTANYLFSL